MPTEILSGPDPSHVPVLWRSVPSVAESKVKSARATVEQEINARLEQARKEGFAAGLAAGRNEAEQRVLPALQNIAGTLHQLSRLRDVMRDETTEDLVRLAISIAARVIHREVSIDPDALSGLLKAAFAKLRSREISRARVHPALEALLRRCLEETGSLNNMALLADPGLLPGEVLFETSQGLLDASVDTQLREIERGLIDKLGK